MNRINNIERRDTSTPVELREVDGVPDSRHITGYAAVFNSPSVELEDWDGRSFVEYIDRGAFAGVIESSDVLAVLNHDDGRGVLARSNLGSGSLTLSVDDTGLRYEFEAPHTALGDELLEGLLRGDITASSFAFSVAEDTWDDMHDGTSVRHIKRIGKLYDVSPVYRPAYPDTSVAKRSLDKHKREDEQQHTEESIGGDNIINNSNTITYNIFTL